MLDWKWAFLPLDQRRTSPVRNNGMGLDADLSMLAWFIYLCRTNNGSHPWQYCEDSMSQYKHYIWRCCLKHTKNIFRYQFSPPAPLPVNAKGVFSLQGALELELADMEAHEGINSPILYYHTFEDPETFMHCALSYYFTP